MEIPWTQALLVSAVGFGSVFALLALLAVIVQITGHIINRLPPRKITPTVDEIGSQSPEARRHWRGTGGS
jgi:Na+-transporting methylmalonyl-CoA/oxaloacetate decarboxylase gamma subunit